MKNLKQPRVLKNLSNQWKILSNLGGNLGTLEKSLRNLGKSINTFTKKAQSTLKPKYFKQSYFLLLYIISL
jgi:hypothetical protein